MRHPDGQASINFTARSSRHLLIPRFLPAAAGRDRGVEEAIRARLASAGALATEAAAAIVRIGDARSDHRWQCSAGGRPIVRIADRTPGSSAQDELLPTRRLFSPLFTLEAPIKPIEFCCAELREVERRTGLPSALSTHPVHFATPRSALKLTRTPLLGYGVSSTQCWPFAPSLASRRPR